MKFLVDVCAGKSLAKWLSERGHDVKEVRERDPRMEDDEILAWAHAEERIVVTVDKDFGSLAVALGKPHCGIIRLPDVPVRVREQLMENLLSRYEEELIKGAIITVSMCRIRIRRPQGGN